MDKYILFADAKSPHTIKWLKELVKYFDIYLITLNGYDSSVLQYIKSDRLFVLNNSVKQKGGNLKLILKYQKLKKTIKSINPKYLNAHYLSSYGFLASLVKLQLPKLTLIHSTWGSDILVSAKKNPIRRCMSRFSLNMAEFVTSDSFVMSDEIRKFGKNIEILTFPFGIEKISKTMYKKDEKLIFSNRILTKNYNIDKILKWFSTLDKSMKLIVANDGEEREKLILKSKSLGIFERVDFVGFLSQKKQSAVYKKAKYYISIPTSDSTSVSLLEAMSFGCYPIVSNLPANREWIIDEFNGSFFYESLKLPKADESIMSINKKILSKKAVFSKNIELFVKRITNE